MKVHRSARSPVRQIGGVLIWGLGVGSASLGAVLVVAGVTYRFLGLEALVDGVSDFPWLGTVALVVALPFVAFILSVWTRVALGHRPGAAR